MGGEGHAKAKWRCWISKKNRLYLVESPIAHYNGLVAGRRDYRFEAIADALQARIRRGEFAAGSLLASERQLQESYSVSRTTIRKALAELVARGWAEAKPNRGVVARHGSATPASHRVAFIDHRDHVHKTLFFKLHTGLATAGFHLVHIDSQDVGTLAALEHAADQGFSAAFVWPKVAWAETGALGALQSRISVIAVDHTIGGEPSDLVMSDHLQGARAVVGHLIGLGRRRIAISGNFTIREDAQMRFSGYTIGLYEHDLSPEASDFVFSSPLHSPFEDTRLLRFRLGQTDRPDAVFVLHDMSVPAIAETIFDCGLKVPEDVAIVGFGNDVPFSVDGVGLTTVGMNWDLLVEALVARLRDRLTHPMAPFRRVLVPTKLVVRGSCGAPPEQWTPDPYEVSSHTVTRRMPPSSDLKAQTANNLSAT